MKDNFYITTTLPYVNNEPHLGFACELVRADILARYKRLRGFNVFLNTGTDEHGLKIFQKAQSLNLSPQEYVDKNSNLFLELAKSLNILDDFNFIRTTDQNHRQAVETFWQKCLENGYIYKKKYQAKYCIGCELEKTDSELINNFCSFHPNQPLEIIEEENYFFRFSSFQTELLNLYDTQPDFVLPSFRQKEIYNFVQSGLNDFSISRLKRKMPWGIEVPNDPEQVIYVWFDALINYLSALNWPMDQQKFEAFWPAVQYCGKDNLRQQAAMWQAMLLSVGIKPSAKIIINGFITVNGQKMSKSLNNIISPLTLMSEYGSEALRYYLARHINPYEDSDFTPERFLEIYNAHLANGLGNLISRLLKMSSTNFERLEIGEFKIPEIYYDYMDEYDFLGAIDFIWQKIAELDEKITKQKPFLLIKKDKLAGQQLLIEMISDLKLIALMLEPFMPNTSQRILTLITNNDFPQESLFSRK